ncbi:UV-endonuclease UvdE-domain-containing protein [Irpex lacteus]|nr:UV-endonuclease UvdE-domain-containing protein [Irpex lacteus]
MRISSEMFPFASHAELGYDLSYAKDELKAVGDLAKKLGHRLTTHPGQFTQLASPKEAVVDASVRELDYHCQMMRYMGLGKDSVIILHMGGVYNDKPTTIARFRENYLNKLTQEMRDRLVLENDEICYSVDDLLPICEELGVPIVLDYHHNWINPSIIPLPTLIPRLNKTWFSKSIRPKQHLSSPRPAFADGSGTIMDRRAHADRCYTLPEELGMDGVARDVDLMVEAKGKEQAVLMLYRIYGLESVEWGSLRPEKEVVKEVKEKGEEGERRVWRVRGRRGRRGGLRLRLRRWLMRMLSMAKNWRARRRRREVLRLRLRQRWMRTLSIPENRGARRRELGALGLRKVSISFSYIYSHHPLIMSFRRRDRHLTLTSQTGDQTHFKTQVKAHEYRRDIS